MSGARLYTPGLELGILAGETRAALIELAAGARLRVVEGAFALDDVLADAEEVFTSSSVREVMPVVGLDERELALRAGCRPSYRRAAAARRAS